MSCWRVGVQLVAISLWHFGCSSDDNGLVTTSTGSSIDAGPFTMDTGPVTDSDTVSNDTSESWPCEHVNEMNPQFRMTSFQIEEPAELSISMILGEIEQAINDLRFIWGVEFNLSNNTITTGAGTSETVPPENRNDLCEISWHSAPYEPTENISIMENNDGTYSTTEPITEISIPVFHSGSLFLTLILSQVQILDMDLSDDLLTIGSPPENVEDDFSFAFDWNTGGTITGWISWESARQATIAGALSLCSLICDSGSGCVEDPNDQDPVCENPPTEIPGSDEKGWELKASFGGGAVTIVN